MIQRGNIRRTTEYTPSNHSRSEQHLLEHLKTTLTHTCCKEYGFILQVHRIVEIHSRKISIYNGNIIVICSIEIDFLLPRVGDRCRGIIRQVFPQGIIATIADCMKVFIPAIEQRRPGENIDFEIIQIRFQKGKYDCIGKQ